MTDPSNELAPLAISQMDQVINVYTMLVQSRASHRMTDNLRWLLRLRKRSFETLSRGPSQRVDAGDAVPLDAEDDRELLGWRTRLIQHCASGQLDSVAVLGHDADDDRGVAAAAGIQSHTAAADYAANRHVLGAVIRSDR
jgi:hypothetical protein